jgi:organic radical activating enzyme
MMDDIQRILEQARRGDSGRAAAVAAHIRRFRHIVLRGAGKFGTAFGAFLRGQGIAVDRLCYWDVRACELEEVKGIRVIAPFSVEFDREETLIINCIPNGSLSGSVGEAEFLGAGYRHYLSGMALFEALMCRMKPETGFDARVCIDTTFCNWCACKRLPALLQEHCRSERGDELGGELVFPVVTFVVNQKCTLQCTHCGQYINHYGAEARVNFPFERIKADVDRVFDAVDAIGFVSIIGGEPFLHPALNEIVDLVLSKRNGGVLGITTNGVCSIEEEHLRRLKNGRTRLIFSDYTAALSEKQRGMFERNVRRVAESGVSYTAGRPLWATPASLRALGLPDAAKAAMKARCNSRISCKTVQNGVYYPCSTTAGIGSHGVAGYGEDWVVIDDTRSAAELRERIVRVEERAYYESCDRCGEGGELLALAGEQGVSERYAHIAGGGQPPRVESGRRA